MTTYRVFLMGADNYVDIEADEVVKVDNHELNVPGQQPAWTFRKNGRQVGNYAVKNISGWADLSAIKNNNRLPR